MLRELLNYRMNDSVVSLLDGLKALGFAHQVHGKHRLMVLLPEEHWATYESRLNDYKAFLLAEGMSEAGAENVRSKMANSPVVRVGFTKQGVTLAQGTALKKDLGHEALYRSYGTSMNDILDPITNAFLRITGQLNWSSGYTAMNRDVMEAILEEVGWKVRNDLLPTNTPGMCKYIWGKDSDDFSIVAEAPNPFVHEIRYYYESYFLRAVVKQDSHPWTNSSDLVAVTTVNNRVNYRDYLIGDDKINLIGQAIVDTGAVLPGGATWASTWKNSEIDVTSGWILAGNKDFRLILAPPCFTEFMTAIDLDSVQVINDGDDRIIAGDSNSLRLGLSTVRFKEIYQAMHELGFKEDEPQIITDALNDLDANAGIIRSCIYQEKIATPDNFYENLDIYKDYEEACNRTDSDNDFLTQNASPELTWDQLAKQVSRYDSIGMSVISSANYPEQAEATGVENLCFVARNPEQFKVDVVKTGEDIGITLKTTDDSAMKILEDRQLAQIVKTGKTRLLISYTGLTATEFYTYFAGVDNQAAFFEYCDSLFLGKSENYDQWQYSEVINGLYPALNEHDSDKAAKILVLTETIDATEMKQIIASLYSVTPVIDLSAHLTD